MLKTKIVRVLSARIPSARVCFIGLVLLSVLPADAGYLRVILRVRLPHEAVSMLAAVREIEPFVEQWQPEWHYKLSKKDVKTRVARFLKASEELLAANKDNGELHLFCGLVAFYGNNVDLKGARDRADNHFIAARKLLPDDYRPSWLLGMHLVSSARPAEGMKALLEAEKKSPISETLFWENYALAAYMTTMFSHSLMALDKARELSGEKSELDGVIGERLRKAALTPDPGEGLGWQALWDVNKSDAAVRILSYPFGYRLAAPKRAEGDLQFTNFDGRFAALKIKLAPRTGAGGATRIPTIQVFTFIPPEKEPLEDFIKRFMGGSRTWRKYDMGLDLNEICYKGESDEAYKNDGGATLIMIAFERDCPKMSGFALEEPDSGYMNGQSGEEPRFFRVNAYYQRFRGRLYYQIWLETPTRLFEQCLVEFKDILSTLVVE